MKSIEMIRLAIILLLTLSFLTGCECKKTENTIREPEETYADNTISAMAEFKNHFFEPDIIYPINHVMVKRISSDMPEVEFVLHGFYGSKACETGIASFNYYLINDIDIRCTNNNFSIKLDGFSTMINTYHENYGICFEDWNFDGYMDICLRSSDGGSMGNQPSLFWLWDNAQTKYVENTMLNEISKSSGISCIPDELRISAYTRVDSNEYGVTYYEYIDDEFVCTEKLHSFIKKIDGKSYRVEEISKLVDGVLQVVSNRTEPLPEP